MFKILFKPIKWLLKIVLVLAILIAIPIALIYKSVTPPEATGVTLDLNSYLESEINDLVDETNNDKTLSLSLGEDIVNDEVKKMMIQQFGASTNPKYVFENENVMFQGVWINFHENKMEIVAGVHANARIATFKTRVLISFKVISDQNPGELTLKLDKFKVGNLSLKWVVKYAPSIAAKFLGQDIDEFIESSLNGMAKYDSKKMELSVDLYSLTESLEENKEMAVMVLDLIYENELLDIGFVKKGDKYEFGLSFDLNVLEDKTPAYVLAELDKIKDQNEFETFLKNKGLSAMMGGSNAIKFNQKDMNKVIDFILAQGGNLANDYLMKTEVLENYELTVLNPYIDIDDGLMLNVPIKFGTATDTFKTTVKIKVDLNKVNDDLEISFSNISIGELNIDAEKIDAVLAILDNEDITGSTMTVAGFFTTFKDAGINITSITAVGPNLLFNFDGLNTGDILEDINNAVTDPELNDKIDELLDKLTNNEDITEDDINELLDIVSGLSEADIDAIMLIINAQIPTP